MMPLMGLLMRGFLLFAGGEGLHSQCNNMKPCRGGLGKAKTGESVAVLCGGHRTLTSVRLCAFELGHSSCDATVSRDAQSPPPPSQGGDPPATPMSSENHP